VTTVLNFACVVFRCFYK